MKKILLVDDDALIARIYGQKLAEAGFEVVVADNGLAAVQRLREFTPDLVVLDLLMPKLTGVDVIKFMRQQPHLRDTRIVVFSNSFLSNLIEQVAAVGVEKALVKASVTPASLIETIHTVLENPPRLYLTAQAMMASLAGNIQDLPVPQITPPVIPVTPPIQVPAASPSRPPPPAPSAASAELDARRQKEFLGQVPAMVQGLRQICAEFLAAPTPTAAVQKLADLRRKLGFVSRAFSLAGRHRFVQLLAALEALVFELQEKPATLNDSVRKTISATVDFIAERVGATAAEDPARLPEIKILVVDDDAVSNRAVVLALGRASLAATSVTDPFDGLARLRQNAYDLVLLDINMPGLDGIALCEQLRALPQHADTPVVFFTGQTDFKTRARAMLNGGTDYITKPILPNELCAKALLLLLKKQPAPR